MLLRLGLILILCVFIARAFWNMVDGLIEGMTGRPRGGSGVPQQGVQMVRDPVCGTFVLPARAVSMPDGRTQLFFCSTTCRDKYRARTGAKTA
jgi:YHS domain-containing protein